MANAMYDKGRNLFASGGVAWKATGGDTIKAFLVDAASYTPDLANNQYLTDVSTVARKGNAGGYTIAAAPSLTLTDPMSGGVCDAADITFTALPAGNTLKYLLLFKSTGVEATSPLLLLIDSATGLPITPNGADINVVWDNGVNRIFKI